MSIDLILLPTPSSSIIRLVAIIPERRANPKVARSRSRLPPRSSEQKGMQQQQRGSEGGSERRAGDTAKRVTPIIRASSPWQAGRQAGRRRRSTVKPAYQFHS